MSLNETPRANRLHIGIFGKRNSGKSSLINALTGQKVAIVSSYAGTTADPVFKAMELHPIGPVVFIDTAGFDDEGELGQLRVEKTKEAVQKTEIAILVFADENLEKEKEWAEKLKSRKIPIIGIINKADISENTAKLQKRIKEELAIDTLIVSALTGQGIDTVKDSLIRHMPDSFELVSIVNQWVDQEDTVLLVMPQDIQAPKGRLILPQVQTIRALLDNRCITISVTADNIEKGLLSLKEPPKLIITDSQCFEAVYKIKPKESLLTSFSILFAAYKGDLNTFLDGANAIGKLNTNSKILIAEACTHAPLAEDIGRVKIPNILKKRLGEGLKVDIVSGHDFPSNLGEYDLIIHCGGCMFNRKYMLSRLENAKAHGVPITNYGVALAQLTGILENITI